MTTAGESAEGGGDVAHMDKLAQALAEQIADYRSGEIPRPTAQHVERWVQQFGVGVRAQILSELNHLLGQTYLSRASVQEFLAGLVVSDKLVDGKPLEFWRGVEFLDIQGGGNSQHEMLQMFAACLKTNLGLELSQCGQIPNRFVYLDDGIFSGNRVRNDLVPWIKAKAPQACVLEIVTVAMHRGGQWFARQALENAAKEAGKNLVVHWWRCIEFEDRKTYINNADVLRPAAIPNDKIVQDYVAGLKYPVVLRKAPGIGEHKLYSSEQARHVLEQELLSAGVRIREMCPQLNHYQRPLGNMVLETPGFGCLFVTFRNCPNNCPLALWAGDPWYPLFPRKINS